MLVSATGSTGQPTVSVLLSSLILLGQASAAEGSPFGPPPRLLDLFFPRLGDPFGWQRPLADPELAGEVTLLVVLSSRSPACDSHGPLLREMHASFGGLGLGILGLAFDDTGDLERDTEDVSAFAERLGLEFPFFLTGRSDPGSATQVLGLREPLRAFPALLLLGRDGSLRAVLDGQAASDEQALRAELRRRIEDLLSEPSDDGAELWSRLRATEWTIRSSRLHMFPSDRAVFIDPEGVRRMHVGGSPTDAPAVEIRGPYVKGVGTWRFDPEAGVLLDPTRFGTRMFPAGGSATPLLESRGFTGEEGLARALAADDPLARREAVFALGDQRKRKGNAPEALRSLGDPVLEVRIAAAWALGEAREELARGPLMELSEHPDQMMRCEALSALAKLVRGPEDLLPFQDLLEDDSDPLGRWAFFGELID